MIINNRLITLKKDLEQFKYTLTLSYTSQMEILKRKLKKKKHIPNEINVFIHEQITNSSKKIRTKIQ